MDSAISLSWKTLRKSRRADFCLVSSRSGSSCLSFDLDYWEARPKTRLSLTAPIPVHAATKKRAERSATIGPQDHNYTYVQKLSRARVNCKCDTFGAAVRGQSIPAGSSVVDRSGTRNPSRPFGWSTSYLILNSASQFLGLSVARVRANRSLGPATSPPQAYRSRRPSRSPNL